MGSSSYVFYLPKDEEPIAYGFSTEYQPSRSASSTRQEVLAQLRMEYWLEGGQKKWGKPRRGVKITLITDSKASMEIMENCQTILGIKDTLKPEFDLSLEILRKRVRLTWITKRTMVKVRSHIEREEAPNTFFGTIMSLLVDWQRMQGR